MVSMQVVKMIGIAKVQQNLNQDDDDEGIIETPIFIMSINL